MHIFWTVLFGLIASLWVIQGTRAGFGMARLPWLSDAPPLSPGNAPSVSVIFAARDEVEKLPGAIETLLAQDYPRFEVVAVNDRSRDQTSEILHEFERAKPNLKVIDIAELPAGWLGKPHALVAGFEQSQGEWIVFTDAAPISGWGSSLATSPGWLRIHARDATWEWAPSNSFGGPLMKKAEGTTGCVWTSSKT